MKTVITAFEKYEQAASEAQQIYAKASLEAGKEDGEGIQSVMNSLQRERARLETDFKREEARAEFFKTLLTVEAPCPKN